MPKIKKLIVIALLINLTLITTTNISLATKKYDVKLKNNAPQAPLGTIRYTIKKGDSLYQIANRLNTTTSNILQFNQIKNPKLIYPGQTLSIPESPPEAIIYTIKPGDTIYQIARKHGTKPAIIIKFNYLDNPNLIFSGQRLVVPVSLRGKKAPSREFF